jgi:hypothetical protein
VKGEVTVERRHFVSSLPADAEEFARADTETKSSVIGRRKQMAWSNEYPEKLLFQSHLYVRGSTKNHRQRRWFSSVTAWSKNYGLM